MRKKTIIQFLLRLAAFCLLLVLSDRLLGFVFSKLYFSQEVGQFHQTTYAVDSARQDILIFGSSRAVRHYDTDSIATATGMSTYNAGRDGQMIPYAAAVEEIALKRNRPKLVILDINAWELADNPSKYEKLTILLPYYDKHPELKTYLSEISPFETYKLYSKVYPFNSSIFILASNALFPASAKKDANGYLPLDAVMTPAFLKEYKGNMEVRYQKIKNKEEKPDQKAIGYYKKFLDATAAAHVPTLVVISPTVIKDPFILDNQEKEKQLVKDIATAYPQVTFLDYSADPRFYDHPEKFSDAFHLNRQGASEFSADLARYLASHFRAIH
ncbi:MAG: hypothetical protein KGO82_05850 [Bacteroidota bacterium]|nr:hypothetical protein [Bacteroidota bacterium]